MGAGQLGVAVGAERPAGGRPWRCGAGAAAATAWSCRPNAGRRAPPASAPRPTPRTAARWSRRTGRSAHCRDRPGPPAPRRGAARRARGRDGCSSSMPRTARSRAGPERGRERAQRLDERLQRRAELLVAAPVEHEPARVVRGAGALRREAGLSDPGFAGQEHGLRLALRGSLPHRGESGQLVAPAHERTGARERSGQRGPRQGDGCHGRGLELVERCQLVDVLAPRQAPQVAVAAVGQRDVLGQVVPHELGHGLGEQHLAGAGQPAQAGGPVERGSEVVAVALERLAGVHGHAQLRRRALGPGLVAERVPQRERGKGAGGGPGEHRHGGVALELGLEHRPAVGGDHLGDQRVVALERGGHGRRVTLPHHRRLDDVREEERDHARRQRGRSRRRGRRRVLAVAGGEHLEVHGLGLGRRVDAELLDEGRAAPLPHPQRLGPFAGRGQRPHEDAERRLAERVPPQRLPCRVDRPGRLAAEQMPLRGRQRRPDAEVTGRVLLLVGPGAVVGQEAPSRDGPGPVRGINGGGAVAGGHRPLGIGDAGHRGLPVHLGVVGQHEAVGAAGRDQRLAAVEPGLHEQLPQPGDDGVERRRPRRGEVLRPEQLGQLLAGHGPVPLAGQVGEDEAALAAGQERGRQQATLRLHLHPSADPDSQHAAPLAVSRLIVPEGALGGPCDRARRSQGPANRRSVRSAHEPQDHLLKEPR